MLVTGHIIKTTISLSRILPLCLLIYLSIAYEPHALCVFEQHDGN